MFGAAGSDEKCCGGDRLDESRVGIDELPPFLPGTNHNYHKGMGNTGVSCVY